MRYTNFRNIISKKEKVEGHSMDFVNNSSPQQAAPAPGAQQGHTKQALSAKKRKLGGKAGRVFSVLILVSAAIILGLLALYVATGSNANEQKYVDKNKFQAVFLNGGQVYFGKVRTLNSKYITLDNIYYLRVNQQVQPDQSTSSSAAQDVSLAKLGCELHGPTDAMVINRDQVLFWENLKADGQVVTAIDKFVQANPQGQKCADTTAANSSTTNTSTPATTTATTKK